MAKPPREGTAPNLESSSKGEAWHSDMAQKGQPELHIEADAADGHGEHEGSSFSSQVRALLQTSFNLEWPLCCICLIACYKVYPSLFT